MRQRLHDFNYHVFPLQASVQVPRGAGGGCQCCGSTHEIFPSRGAGHCGRGDPLPVSGEAAWPGWARHPAGLWARCPGCQLVVKGHGDPLTNDRGWRQQLCKANSHAHQRAFSLAEWSGFQTFQTMAECFQDWLLNFLYMTKVIRRCKCV